jgi:hypothetical protein
MKQFHQSLLSALILSIAPNTMGEQITDSTVNGRREVVITRDDVFKENESENDFNRESVNFEYNNLRINSAATKPLVIRSGAIDAQAAKLLEEDLTIMARILAKTLREAGVQDEKRVAMGIQLETLGAPTRGVLQNFYLENYGAMFMLNVRFPLTQPPKKKAESTHSALTGSEWEETRRELFGADGLRSGAFRNGLSSMRVWTSKTQPVEYDAERVEKLKEALWQSLKNATHIRGLKPEEFVTVTVLGPEPVHPQGGNYQVRSSNRNPREVFAYAQALDGAESILTMRARKSDVDAFAKGSLAEKEFKDKVSITIY